MDNKLRFQKLNQSEHEKTRPLWEEVFFEDTAEFLDYYYAEKIKDNTIYVAEQDGEILSMLHLNPFTVRVKEELYPTHYIVAVATKEPYRGQGMMRRLMEMALQDMTDLGEPFTFLMPANEKIYLPFGFQTVYQTPEEHLTADKPVDLSNSLNSEQEEILACPESISYRIATAHDCKAMADFANHILKPYDVVIHRDESYYQRLLSEQASERGGILICERQGQITGLLPFGREDGTEVREPLFTREEDLQGAVSFLDAGPCTLAGCQIMAKVLNPDKIEDFEDMRFFINEIV